MITCKVNINGRKILHALLFSDLKAETVERYRKDNLLFHPLGSKGTSKVRVKPIMKERKDGLSECTVPRYHCNNPLK